jgi:hypothetical protein
MNYIKNLNYWYVSVFVLTFLFSCKSKEANYKISGIVKNMPISINDKLINDTTKNKIVVLVNWKYDTIV